MNKNNKILRGVESVTNIPVVKITIVLIVLAFIAYFMFIRKKKFVPDNILPPMDTPPPVGGGASTNSSGTSQQVTSNREVNRIAVALYEEMDGLNIWTRKLQPYQDFANLSDTDVVRVYNRFNELYEPKSGHNLYEWIDAERVAWGGYLNSISIWNQSEATKVRALVNDVILPRLRKLTQENK